MEEKGTPCPHPLHTLITNRKLQSCHQTETTTINIPAPWVQGAFWDAWIYSHQQAKFHTPRQWMDPCLSSSLFLLSYHISSQKEIKKPKMPENREWVRELEIQNKKLWKLTWKHILKPEDGLHSTSTSTIYQWHLEDSSLLSSISRISFFLLLIGTTIYSVRKAVMLTLKAYFKWHCLRRQKEREREKVRWIMHACHAQLFVTPWTVRTVVFCPWDFPGKNTSMGCYLPLPREVSAPATTCIWDGPSSFVVPTLVLDFRLIHLSPHWTPSLDCPATNSTGTNLCSLCPLPSKTNSCSFRMPLRSHLPVLSRRDFSFP